MNIIKQNYSLLEWTCNKKQCIHPMDSYSALKGNYDSCKNLDESQSQKVTYYIFLFTLCSQHDQGTETENRWSFSEVKWWHGDR